jgi:formylglycine-generating enzyme required for sulfatase activity
LVASGGTIGPDGTDVEDDGGISGAPCEPNCPVLEWVEIRGGTFIMGSPDGIGRDNERPQHQVTVPDFRITKTEVTVRQYNECVDSGVCRHTDRHNDDPQFNWGKPDRENHPCNGVSWTQAREFAEWVGARLPTEAEWEYAARSGGRDITYPWGDMALNCEHAVIHDYYEGAGCSVGSTMEVCSKPLGNSDQGLCDMIGNVAEWVEDDFHWGYIGAPSDNSAWIDTPRSDQGRVVRGGAWYDPMQVNYRCASRSNSLSVDYKNGFRVVMDQ